MNSETKEGIGISKRDFLKGVSATAVYKVLASGLEPGKRPPEKPKVPEVEKAEEMAQKLLRQIDGLGWTDREGKKLSHLIVHAVRYTSEITFRKEHHYEEAKAMFERLSDSMLMLGAVRALNKILKEEKLIFSWQDIKKAKDIVISEKSQQLSAFEEILLDLGGVEANQWDKLGGNQKKALGWGWRALPGKKGAIVRDGLGEDTGHYLTLRPAEKGEVVMLKKVEKRLGPIKEIWYETSVERHIPLTSTEEPSWLRRVLSWFNPDTVFIRAKDLTLTFP